MHTFSCDVSFSFVANEWRQFIQQWSPSWFDVIPCNNIDKLCTARQSYFLPPGIIRRITWFGCSELCFEIYASLISFLLCGTNKTLRVIDLLLKSFSHFLHGWESLCPSIHTDLRRDNCLLFFVDLFWCFHLPSSSWFFEFIVAFLFLIDLG